MADIYTEARKRVASTTLEQIATAAEHVNLLKSSLAVWVHGSPMTSLPSSPPPLKATTNSQDLIFRFFNLH